MLPFGAAPCSRAPPTPTTTERRLLSSPPQNKPTKNCSRLVCFSGKAWRQNSWDSSLQPTAPASISGRRYRINWARGKARRQRERNSSNCGIMTARVARVVIWLTCSISQRMETSLWKRLRLLLRVLSHSPRNRLRLTINSLLDSCSHRKPNCKGWRRKRFK